MSELVMKSEEERIIRARTRKPMMYLSLVGISMLFAGLTSAYIIKQSSADWLEFELPNVFYTSTIFIVISSLTMLLATQSIKRGNKTGLIVGSGLTLVLGIAFTIAQFDAYDALTEQGFYLSGGNVASSFLYILSGVHLAHIAGGIISLFVVFIKSLFGKYSAENKLGVELAAIYWHYLDFVWIYLLLFLLFIR